MNKKVWKILAFILAAFLIISIITFANGLMGNPVSALLADHAAQEYLRNQHPGTDYYVEDIAFNFKFTCYFAHIRSHSSQDTQFTLYIDLFGNVYFNTYDDVMSGFVTERRLDDEYRALTDLVLDSHSFPYPTDIAYGTLEIHGRDYIQSASNFEVPDYALVREELILDHIYDVRELGTQAGHIILYVYTDSLTAETAAQILLKVRDAFDTANVPFRAIDLILRYPKPEEGVWQDDSFGVQSFPYEDIYEENLTQRVAAANQEYEEYYSILDETKK